MIQQAVSGEVDLSTYADVNQAPDDAFVALTSDELSESDLTGMVAPAFVDNANQAVNSNMEPASIRLAPVEPIPTEAAQANTVNERIAESQASLTAPIKPDVIVAAVEPSLVKSDEAKSDQAKPNEAKSDQAKPDVAATPINSNMLAARINPNRTALAKANQEPLSPIYKTSKPPLAVLAKIPNIVVTGHLYSSSPDRRSVTFNRRVFDEGDSVTSDVVLLEITRSGFNLAVDGYLVPIKRGRGWRAISAE